VRWWAIDDPTPARLIDALGEAFAAHARAIFDTEPRMQTIIMAVAQFWDDDAPDEVHADLFYSTTHTAPWPHNCDDADDHDLFFCESCFMWSTDGRSGDFELPTLNDRVTRAIEAFCGEGANREMTWTQTHLPLWVARRRVDTAEFVGQLQRPWQRPDLAQVAMPPPDIAPLFAEVYRQPASDGPRQVLADCLQAAGDPRGDFIALQMHQNSTAEMRADIARLAATHRNGWLDAFLTIASPARCRFTRGFVSALAVGPAPMQAFAALDGSPAWATIESLAFPELDAPPDWPMLAAFSQIARIDAPTSVLQRMGAAGEWALTRLHCTGTGGIDGLGDLQVPRLRHLMIEDAHPRTLERLVDLPWWRRLVQLDLVSTNPVAAFAAAVSRTRAHVRVIAPYAQAFIERTGREAARVHPGPHAGSMFAPLAKTLRAALPPVWKIDAAEPLTPLDRRDLLTELWIIAPL
jgi:uncharacterized protein (TIGR02996 family)